jgi:mono/diheme cytochrome c family protein
MENMRLRFSLLFLFLLAALTLGAARVFAQGEGDDQLQEGARLFAENCAMCHGANGEGRVGATLAQDWPSIRPDLTIRATIERGVPGSPMVAFGQEHGGPLSDEQIESLVAYILTWESGVPFTPPPTRTASPRPMLTEIPEVEGDPNHGAVLYDENCAVCHGANLEGRVGATLAKNWPAIRPDQTIKTTISNGVQGSPMPGWSQASGGPLSETDVNDLVAFILSHEGEIQLEPAAEATPPPAPSPFAGWSGVLVLVLGLILVIGLALVAQARRA